MGFLLQAVFGGLFTWLTQFVTKKVAGGIALAVVIVALSAAFYLAIKTVVVGVVPAIGNQWLLMIFYTIWPSNAETCFTIIFGAEVTAYIYRHKIMVVLGIAQST